LLKIFCNNCNVVSYVGQTKRQLKTRISEHVKNIKSDESRYLVVTKHMLENNLTFDWQNIKIMDFGTNYCKSLISKIIYIKTQKKELNSVGDIECLDFSCFNLLSKIFDKK